MLKNDPAELKSEGEGRKSSLYQRPLARLPFRPVALGEIELLLRGVHGRTAPRPPFISRPLQEHGRLGEGGGPPQTREDGSHIRACSPYQAG